MTFHILTKGYTLETRVHITNECQSTICGVSQFSRQFKIPTIQIPTKKVSLIHFIPCNLNWREFNWRENELAGICLVGNWFGGIMPGGNMPDGNLNWWTNQLAGIWTGWKIEYSPICTLYKYILMRNQRVNWTSDEMAILQILQTMCVCVCMYVCVFVCVFVSVCVGIYSL